MHKLWLFFFCVGITIPSGFSSGRETDDDSDDVKIEGFELINQDVLSKNLEGNIRRIELSNNGKIDVGPQNFTAFQHLEELVFSDTKFVEVPLGIFNGLNQLKRLEISSQPNLTTLNKNLFDQLKNLEQLDLTKNGLTNLEPGIFKNQKNLSILELSDNHLGYLHLGTFNKLKNLTTLELSDNNLEYIDPGVFDDLGNLRELDLSNNQLKYLTPKMFDKLKKLEFLGLNDNNITDLEPGFLSITGKRKRNLVIIMFNNGIKQIRKSTFHGSVIKTLDLSSNQISKIEPDAFYGTSIEELYLRSNNLTTISERAFNGIISLDELNLSKNKLSYLRPEFFDGLATLKTIDLSQNMIANLEQGVFYKLRRVYEPSFLNLTLNLERNNIAIIHNSTFSGLNIQKLDLNSNKLSEIRPGAFSGLKVKNLDLSDNIIKKVDMNISASGLETETSITW